MTLAPTSAPPTSAPPTRSLPTAHDAGLHLASVDLVRRGALLPSALTGWRATATSAVERQHAAVAAGLDAAAEQLESALHAAVPLVEAPVRRTLLKLKRSVHNRRPLPLVEEPLPAGLYGLVDAYTSAVAARDVLEQAAETAAAEDRHVAWSTTLALLAEPAVRRGLAATAPEVAAELTRSGAAEQLADPRSALTRTVTGYLTRIALKPSPASSFATVDFVTDLTGDALSSDGPDGAEADPRADVRLAPALAYGLLLAWAGSPAFGELIELAPVESLPGGQVLLAERLDIDGYLFRHDQLSGALGGAWLEAALALGRATAAAHRAVQLALDPRADAVASVERLLQAGTLQVVLPWSDHDRRHEVLAQLARTAAAAAREEGQATELVAVASVLERLQSSATTLATATHLQALGLFATLRREARTIAVLGSAATGVEVSEPALVHETVGGRLLPRDLASGVPAGTAALEQALDLTLRPRLVRSLAHAGLADFVADRLAPGVRVPFTAVLELLGDAEATDHHLMRWAMRDVQATAGDPSAAPGVLAPSVSAHLQQAGDLTVLNAAMPGAAAAALRHLPVLGGRGEPARDLVEGRLGAWLSSLAPGGRWLALAAAEEWSDLQGAPFLDAARLRWPADPPRRPGSRALDSHGPDLELTDLWLAHQPESSTLRLEDPAGAPLALVPVGAISPFLVSGPLRALLVCADPWVLRPALLRPSYRDDLADGPVAGARRVTVGPLVVQRRTWWVPTAGFPRADRTEPTLAFLRRVEAWRAARDLPEEVFVRADTGPMELNPRLRKPQWLRWDVPQTLTLAARLADRSPRLVLTEALPAVADAAGPATETVRFLGWPGDATSEAWS